MDVKISLSDVKVDEAFVGGIRYLVVTMNNGNKVLVPAHNVEIVDSVSVWF